jgi:hypothetical protein
VKDRDVREALHAILEAEHAHDDSLILDELGLAQGDVRVDVAVINGSLSGYEIKSASDTLKRLPGQQSLYSQVLDHAWLVAPADKLNAAADLIPEWWGLVEISEGSEGIDLCLNVQRQASMNPQPDPTVIAALLWRDEALATLERHGGTHGFRTKPRAALWAALSERLTLDTLRAEVRTTLKTRGPQWRRARSPHGPDGARSRSGATPPRFLDSLSSPRRL